MAWVFFLQRRDEQRHAMLFDRIAAEVLGLPGDTPAERRAAARAHVPPALLELFEERLPAMAAELAAGRTGLSEGVSLYHMLLEGVVFDAGQHALLDDLADGALPGVREGVERVERDERWHVGFGLRCLIETRPSARASSTTSWSGPRRPPTAGATPSPRPRASERAARSPTGSTSPGSSRRARRRSRARRDAGHGRAPPRAAPSACRRRRRPSGRRRCRRRWRGPPAGPPRAGRRPAPPADPRHGRRPPATRARRARASPAARGRP